MKVNRFLLLLAAAGWVWVSAASARDTRNEKLVRSAARPAVVDVGTIDVVPGLGGGPPPCRDPMADDLQAKLLNDFGDKGIDANGDGTLTCDEVKAFFDANPSLRPPRPGGPPPCRDPMPDDLQAKLLNDFGDKGIDANGDGTLTCDEVKAFFDANPPPGSPPCRQDGAAGARTGNPRVNAGTSSTNSEKAAASPANNGRKATPPSARKK
jgi:hypothetical protein